jgi:hypothetical protein
VKKVKLNQKQRRALRRKQRADGTYVAPLPRQPGKKKRKTPSQPPGGRDSKPKKAGLLPGIVPERRPRFIAHTNYFTGGGVITRLVIPPGWQLITAPHPGPAEYRLAELRSLPTPDGTAKIGRFVLRDATKADMAQRAIAVIEEEKKQRHKRALEKEHALLEIKTVISRVRGTRERRKK